MFIVATVGRCGSSVLTKFFERVGYDVGKVRWIEELDAGYEDQLTGNINNMLIKGKIKEAQMKMIAVQADIIKDPQFLVRPEIILHWKEMKKDIKVIFLTRDPEDIVASLKRNPTMNSPVFRNHADLIKDHEDKFLKVLDVNSIPYNVFKFPDFLEQPMKFHEWMKSKAGKNRWKNAWKEIMDENKIHIK